MWSVKWFPVEQFLNKAYALLGNLVIGPWRVLLSGRIKTKDRFSRVLTWPNAISVIRVPLGILIQFIPHHRAWTLAVVFAAFYTDAVDGALAKEFFGRTRSGAVIDPACDKAFFVLYAWAHRGDFNPVALGALALTEIFLFSAQMSALIAARSQGRRFTERSLRSNIFGKTKGFLECSALLLPFAGNTAPAATITLWLAVLAAFLSVVKQKKDNPDAFEQ